MKKTEYGKMSTEQLIDSEKEIYKKENKTEVSSLQLKTNGPKTKNGTGIIINSLHVKVRRSPSLDSDVLEVLSKDSKVTLLGKDKQFYKVSYGINKIGYIFSDYIKEA